MRNPEAQERHNPHDLRFDLMELVRNCPEQVAPEFGGKVRISGNRRLVLLLIAMQTDSFTGEASVTLRSVRSGSKLSPNTVRAVITDLTSAGLLSADHRLGSSTEGGLPIVWKINASRLRAIVGEKPSDQTLHGVLAEAARVGVCNLITPSALVEDSRSRMLNLAGDFRIAFGWGQKQNFGELEVTTMPVYAVDQPAYSYGDRN
jgi:hypothetical protein